MFFFFICKDIVSMWLELIWKVRGIIGFCLGVLYGFEFDIFK